MLPCQRKTRSQSRQGRSHQALVAKNTLTCPGCGEAKLPHCACKACGYVRPGLKVGAQAQA